MRLKNVLLLSLLILGVFSIFFFSFFFFNPASVGFAAKTPVAKQEITSVSITDKEDYYTKKEIENNTKATLTSNSLNFNLFDGESSNITLYTIENKEEKTIPYESALLDKNKFGFVLDKTQVKDTRDNLATWENKIYYKIKSSENYTKIDNYTLQRTFSVPMKNQVNNIENRTVVRTLSFEGVFKKKENLYNITFRDVATVVCDVYTQLEGKNILPCIKSHKELVNTTIKQPRNISFNLYQEGDYWIAKFYNIYDLDPSFVDDVDSDFNLGQLNDTVIVGTGASANVTLRNRTSQINASRGTPIGDMNLNGGLGALFDNELVEDAGNGGSGDNKGKSGFAGKDWGAGVQSIIVGFRVYCTTSDACAGDGGGVDMVGDINVTLQGSNDNFASEIIDLGASGPINNVDNLIINFSNPEITAAYRYHRVRINGSAMGGEDRVRAAEVQFFLKNYSLQGNFTSQSFDSGTTSSNWTVISWTEEVPYQKEIGRASVDGASPGYGGANTTGNFLLLHLNNESDFKENDSLFYDFSGSGNNGTCSGATCAVYNSTNKKLGGASLTFDGVDDVINIPHDNAFNVGANDWAISLWIMDNDGIGPVISKGGGGGAQTFCPFYITGSLFYYGNELNAWVISGLNLGPSDVGEWKHVTVVRNGTNVSSYYNGIYRDSKSVAGALVSNNRPFYLGLHAGAGAVSYFNGSIDEVAIWNRSLSADEARDLYYRGALELNISTRTSDDNSTWTAWSSANVTLLDAVQTQIAQIIGTVIKDGAGWECEAAAFDGDTTQTYAGSGCGPEGAVGAYKGGGSGDTGYLGKNWGSGNKKTISRYIIYPTTDQGFARNEVTNITFALNGSNDGSSWTTLHTDTFTSDITSGSKDYSSGIITTTEYQYHAVEISSSGASNVLTSEIVFYEDLYKESGNFTSQSFIKARYLQYRAEFNTIDSSITPKLEDVTVWYTLLNTSCTYSSGRWEINAGDNCAISSVVDLDGEDAICAGDLGTFAIGTVGKIVNFKNFRVYPNCSILCYNSAGCFD